MARLHEIVGQRIHATLWPSDSAILLHHGHCPAQPRNMRYLNSASTLHHGRWTTHYGHCRAQPLLLLALHIQPRYMRYLNSATCYIMAVAKHNPATSSSLPSATRYIVAAGSASLLPRCHRQCKPASIGDGQSARDDLEPPWQHRMDDHATMYFMHGRCTTTAAQGTAAAHHSKARRSVYACVHVCVATATPPT